MCMMELATKTMTADRTIGSHKAVSGTMGSLLWAREPMPGFFPARLPLARRCGQARFITCHNVEAAMHSCENLSSVKEYDHETAIRRNGLARRRLVRLAVP